jgi:hypothetical protein
VVELQGYEFHSHRTAFERDHAKLARLKLAGFETLAFTWRQVTMERAATARLIATLLARAGMARTS